LSIKKMVRSVGLEPTPSAPQADVLNR